MAGLRIMLFGYPRVELDGQEVNVDTRKAVALLAYLAVTGESPSRDTIAALLWPDYDQTSARGALRRTLSVLNKATGSEFLAIGRERIELHRGAEIWTDVRAFQEALANCESIRKAHGLTDPAYLSGLTAAINLCRERFMVGFSLRDSSAFDDWQYLQAEQWAHALANALENLARGEAAAGNTTVALGAARRWLAQDNLMEEAHRFVMLLEAQSGQRSAALRQYRECARILAEELGVQPLAETTDLYHAILENRIEQVSPLVETTSSAEGSSFSQQREAQDYPLVGRENELEVLNRIFEKTRSNGQFVILEGEGGIGKTRLLDEFSRRAAAQGSEVLLMRCFEGENGLAYAPFVSGLVAAQTRPGFSERIKHLSPAFVAEAARLAPEISVKAEPLRESIPEGPGVVARFMEGIRQVLFGLVKGHRPGVIILDDIQWADAASLDLLTYMLRRLQDSPVMVIAAWRSDITAPAALAQMIYDTQRGGIFSRLVLERLKREDIERLAESMLQAGSGNENVAGRLLQETEGLPFFVVEYLELLRREPAYSGESNNWELPARVRDVLHQRLSGIDEAALQLLGTAAVIGRSFGFSTLRDVSGRSEMETINGLELLTGRGLIVENTGEQQSGEIFYDFRHEKLRGMIYDETSQARRRLLHRRVAETLSRPAGRVSNPSGAAVIAHHYRLAGMNEQAAEYYCLAGDQARTVFANADAMMHYRAALAAHHDDPAYLHEAIGDVETLLGEYRVAIASFENAAAHNRDGCQAQLEHKLGIVHARMGAFDRAVSHYQAALEVLDARCNKMEQAGILADWSYAAYKKGYPAQALDLAEQALQTAIQAEDEATLAQAHNNLGMLARSQGNLKAAAEHLEQSLRIAEKAGSPLLEIAALNNLARMYAEMGQLDLATETGKQALERCSQVGDRHREAAILNNLADVLHAHGKTEEAMSYLKQAVTIFAEIGMDGGAMEPEIWKLAEW